MPTQLITRQFKIKTNAALIAKFETNINACRTVYNLCKELSDYSYKAYGKSFSHYDLQNQLPELKKHATWLADANSQSLCNAVERYVRSMENFYKKRAKYPKYANKKDYRSFTVPQRVEIRDNKIYLMKIGLIRVFGDLSEVQSKIRTATIVRKASGWYVSLVFDKEIEHLPKLNTVVGVDVGTHSLYTTSDEEHITNNRYLFKHEARLKKLQRELSRKKKGSANYERARIALAKQHEKVANARKDYAHKQSRELIDEYGAIVVEGIKIDKLVQGLDGAKQILDAGWGQFRNMLKYKAEWYGREYIEVPPINTNKTCNVCGHVEPTVQYYTKAWTCPSCNTAHNRNINSAKTILNAYLSQ